MTPQETAQIASDRMLAAVKLDGYFKIWYYTGDVTVYGIYMPEGLCVCGKYNRETEEYEQFDSEFDSFSEYHQRAILLEVGEKYCEQPNKTT